MWLLILPVIVLITLAAAAIAPQAEQKPLDGFDRYLELLRQSEHSERN
jgi:hypothetical protein